MKKYGPYHTFHKKEESIKDAKELREKLGLKPIKQGKRLCLKCDGSFFSYDLCNEKICGACKERPFRNE